MRYPKSFVATKDKVSTVTQLRTLLKDPLPESVCRFCANVTRVCYFLRHLCEGIEQREEKKKKGNDG